MRNAGLVWKTMAAVVALLPATALPSPLAARPMWSIDTGG